MNLKKLFVGIKPYTLWCLLMKTNQEQDETQLFLEYQLSLGFKPKYFVSFHYYHSTETSWKTIEEKKTLDFGNRIGFKCRNGFWNEVEIDKAIDRKRNDYDCIVKDTKHIKNTILKYLYGIKRLNQTWKYEFPNLFFFHEKGKVGLQYHTHLLMPEKNLKYKNEKDLYNYLNSNLRRKSNCFSKWKTIHIREIDSPLKAVSYVNKETNKFHNSLDYQNSHFILPNL